MRSLDLPMEQPNHLQTFQRIVAGNVNCQHATPTPKPRRQIYGGHGRENCGNSPRNKNESIRLLKYRSANFIWRKPSIIYPDLNVLETNELVITGGIHNLQLRRRGRLRQPAVQLVTCGHSPRQRNHSVYKQFCKRNLRHGKDLATAASPLEMGSRRAHLPR
jgi:hypothetical protein